MTIHSFFHSFRHSIVLSITLSFFHSIVHSIIHSFTHSLPQLHNAEKKNRWRANTSREAVGAEPPFPWCLASNLQSWRAPRLELESYHKGSHWKKRICLLSVKQAQRTFGRDPISRLPLAEKVVWGEEGRNLAISGKNQATSWWKQ